MERLKGKVAVITGGASGIGEASVRRFVEEGAKVVIADLQDAKALKIVDELGGAAVYQRTDVSQEADIIALMKRAVDEFGGLDCVFNNAGVGGASGSILETPVEEYEFTMRILVRSVFLGIKHGAATLLEHGGGTIINTSSVAGFRAGFAHHIYSAAKAAVLHLTRTTALELGERGIRINAICPGAIATPILAGETRAKAENIEMMKGFLAEMQSIPRAGLPIDIANAALWLASDESSFVHGEALVVDGGYSPGPRWSAQLPTLKQRRPLKL